MKTPMTTKNMNTKTTRHKSKNTSYLIRLKGTDLYYGEHYPAVDYRTHGPVHGEHLDDIEEARKWLETMPLPRDTRQSDWEIVSYTESTVRITTIAPVKTETSKTSKKKEKR